MLRESEEWLRLIANGAADYATLTIAEASRVTSCLGVPKWFLDVLPMIVGEAVDILPHLVTEMTSALESNLERRGTTAFCNEELRPASPA